MSTLHYSFHVRRQTCERSLSGFKALYVRGRSAGFSMNSGDAAAVEVAHAPRRIKPTWSTQCKKTYRRSVAAKLSILFSIYLQNKTICNRQIATWYCVGSVPDINHLATSALIKSIKNRFSEAMALFQRLEQNYCNFRFNDGRAFSAMSLRQTSSVSCPEKNTNSSFNFRRS